MKTIRVMTIFGTRPEAIKMAPLVKELEGRAGVESLCCVTAQHREMLDSVLHIFQLTPQYDLNIMEPRQTLSTITSKCLLGVEQVLQEAKPDLVLVHGDTSTTFSGALAAFYQRVMVGHVEAGLRTYDKYSPFPEEMNRTLWEISQTCTSVPPGPTGRIWGGRALQTACSLRGTQSSMQWQPLL